MPSTIVEYKGKLAVSFGILPAWDRPRMEEELHVSNIPADQWPTLIGTVIRNWNGNQALVWAGELRPVHLDTTDWNRIIEDHGAIRRPRNSTNMVYRSGRWTF